MEPPRQKWTARLILAGAGLAMAAWLLGSHLKSRISTDVLDLVPSGSGSPDLAMVRSLADQEEARVLLLAVRVAAGPGETSAAAAARSDHAAEVFARALAASPAVAAALPLSDSGPRDAMARELFQHRLELLLPAWLDARSRQYASSGSAEPWPAWLAEDSAKRLEGYLARPEAMAAQDLLTADPLLLIPGLKAGMEGLVSSGLGSGRSGGYSLVWALSRGSPLKGEGQQPVFDAVDSALAAARAAEPGTELRWTGIARFAAASRARIEGEVGTLNVLSLCLVVVVAAACVRRVYRALHLVPVVAGALLGAWTATTIAWPRVHILVFVIGSLLAGVAVDYGFYLCLQPPLRPDEPYRERAARLMRPLLASALTTVIGFSFLLWSELPLIRQLGVFVSAGLVCALGAALLWFAQVENSTLETRDFIGRRPARAGGRTRTLSRAILAIGAAVAIAGPWRLHWRDDIRELEIPTPDVAANDSEVRSLFGDSGEKTVYLTRGSDIAQARANLQLFMDWHQKAFPRAATVNLGGALPTAEEWGRLPRELAGLRDFPGEMRQALARHGFDPGAFSAFFTAWGAEAAAGPQAPYGALARRFESALQGPVSSLVHDTPGSSWFVTISEQGPGADPPASTSTVTDSQLKNLNQLFHRYRISALRLSSAGLAFVGASVFALYGLRRGARIFAIPAGACLFAFGLFGLAGATLNLFNLLGAFLGVCLSHNYAIFTAESLRRGEDPPPSIRMSSMATASSFGVLALSRIPVVSALGSTVAVIVLAALAITELTPLASGEESLKHPGP